MGADPLRDGRERVGGGDDASPPRAAVRLRVPLELTIRPCREDDLPLLEWDGRFASHRPIMERTLAGQARGTQIMLVADIGGYPVGQAWVDLEKRRDGDAGVVWAVRVLSWLRGQGIGAHLVRAAERALAARGRRWAVLGVERTNTRARRFYERLGYEAFDEVVETYQLSGSGGPRRHVADQILLRRRVLRDP